jgi:hypothetical protein
MQVDRDIQYHPTLRTLCNAWLQQRMSQRSLNFLLYVGVLHGDKKLTGWCLKMGADVHAKPEKFYIRFLGNLKVTVKGE